MARTTATEVKAIMDTTIEDTKVDGFIVGANLLVTQTLENSGLSVELLAEIERWVTAHMITVSIERLAMEEGAGGAYIKYAGQFGAGFESTSYGQMAIALDTTGALKALGKKQMYLKGFSQE